VKKTKKKERPPRPKKDLEEPPDQDELQALDEANEPWVAAWRKAVHGK